MVIYFQFILRWRHVFHEHSIFNFISVIVAGSFVFHIQYTVGCVPFIIYHIYRYRSELPVRGRRVRRIRHDGRLWRGRRDGEDVGGVCSLSLLSVTGQSFLFAGGGSGGYGTTAGCGGDGGMGRIRVESVILKGVLADTAGVVSKVQLQNQYTVGIISDDFRPIFIGNPIFWIQETDNSNGAPILCQIAFSSLSFPFFVWLKLF